MYILQIKPKPNNLFYIYHYIVDSSFGLSRGYDIVSGLSTECFLNSRLDRLGRLLG